MKKIRNLIIILLVFLGIIAISNNVNAATSSVTLQKIEVTSPSGTYTTGQEITIVATFSGNVVSSTVPQLKIQFGSLSAGERYINEGTISGNTITYKYTIASTDGGELSLKKYYGSLKDEAGDTISVDYTGSLSGSTITANPLIWADASNFTAKIEKSSDSIYLLYLSGVSNVNTDIYVYVTNGNTEPNVWNSTSNQFNDGYLATWKKNDEKFTTNCEKYIELSGDIYVWLYQSQKDYGTGKIEYKLVKSSKVERPDQNSLNKRISGYFLNDSTSISILEFLSSAEKRNVKIKIGKVTDISILKSIKNGEAGCLSKLLTYSKNANSTYTGTIKVEQQGASILSNVNLLNHEYYYVYMVLDDENGKYYPVEDVSLYQAFVGQSGKYLKNYLDKEFTWDAMDETETPSTNEPTDSTITPDNKLPQTGATVTIIAIIGITAVIAVVAGIKLKKYNF